MQAEARNYFWTVALMLFLLKRHALAPGLQRPACRFTDRALEIS